MKKFGMMKLAAATILVVGCVCICYAGIASQDNSCENVCEAKYDDCCESKCDDCCEAKCDDCCESAPVGVQAHVPNRDFNF